MKQSVKTILWVAAFIIILGGAYWGYTALNENYNDPSSSNANENDNNPPSSNVYEETTPAADFTAYDADGNEVTLSSKFGKPIVLNFWATWCGPCRVELPDFNKVYEELGDEVEFVMVNVDDPGTEADVKDFLSENDYTFPVYYDADYNGARAYSVTGIPVTYFINTDGEILIMATQRGIIDEDKLRESIDRILD